MKRVASPGRRRRYLGQGYPAGHRLQGTLGCGCATAVGVQIGNPDQQILRVAEQAARVAQNAMASIRLLHRQQRNLDLPDAPERLF